MCWRWEGEANLDSWARDRRHPVRGPRRKAHQKLASVPAGVGSEIDRHEPPAFVLRAEWPQEPACAVLKIGTTLNDRHGLLETKSAGRVAAIAHDNGGEIRQRRNPFPVGKDTGPVDRNEVAESDRAWHSEAVCRGWHCSP